MVYLKSEFNEKKGRGRFGADGSLKRQNIAQHRTNLELYVKAFDPQPSHRKQYVLKAPSQ